MDPTQNLEIFGVRSQESGNLLDINLCLRNFLREFLEDLLKDFHPRRFLSPDSEFDNPSS